MSSHQFRDEGKVYCRLCASFVARSDGDERVKHADDDMGAIGPIATKPHLAGRSENVLAD